MEERGVEPFLFVFICVHLWLIWLTQAPGAGHFPTSARAWGQTRLRTLMSVLNS